jgi:hypothetical protein
VEQRPPGVAQRALALLDAVGRAVERMRRGSTPTELRRAHFS